MYCNLQENQIKEKRRMYKFKLTEGKNMTKYFVNPNKPESVKHKNKHTYAKNFHMQYRK